MPKTYSGRRTPEISYKRTNAEEKELRRRIALVSLLTVSLLLLIYFFGIPFVRFVGLIGQRFGGSDSAVVSDENPRPFTPRLQYLPNYTNKSRIEVKGFADPEVRINLRVNGGEPLITDADESGSFEFLNVSLKEGSNTLSATAIKDDQESDAATTNITFDKKAPTLEVHEPADNAFFPKNTTMIKVSGKTESDAIIEINDFQAIVDPEGNFSFDLPVSGGEQKVKIVAKDNAGNQKVIEKPITVDHDPESSPSSSPN